MGILKREILRDIEQAKTKLDTSKIPQFTQEVFKNTEEQCMENVALQDSDNAERGKAVLSSFRDAWKYGMANFEGNWDLLYLTEVAGRVEPGLRVAGQTTYAELRSQIRQFRGGYVPPVDRERILKNLDRTLLVSQAGDLAPVERAIFEYFHLIRIQPFLNGNKRTANIVMNGRLSANGLLPICVSPRQVPEFESYLVGAIEGFKETESQGDTEELVAYTHPDFRQRQFFDFLGRRELCSLRCAENQMSGLTTYTLNLHYSSPAAEYSLKHGIDRYFRAKGLTYQVRASSKDKTIVVTGEIPIRTLQQLAERTPGIKKCKIKVANGSH